MNLAAKTYLEFLIASDYPEQEPAHKVAKNRDLLWFLVPVMGFLLFALAIQERYENI